MKDENRVRINDTQSTKKGNKSNIDYKTLYIENQKLPS